MHSPIDGLEPILSLPEYHLVYSRCILHNRRNMPSRSLYEERPKREDQISIPIDWPTISRSDSELVGEPGHFLKPEEEAAVRERKDKTG